MRKQEIYTYLFKNKDKGITFRRDTTKEWAIRMMGQDYKYLGRVKTPRYLSEMENPIVEYIDYKYVLLEDDEIWSRGNTKLYRIIAVKNIGRKIKAGDLGGYIDGYDSLNQEGKCFIHNGSKVIKSRIMNNAEIYGDSLIYNAVITGNSIVNNCYIHHQVYISDKVHIFGVEIEKSILSDNVYIVSSKAKIYGSIISQDVSYPYKDCVVCCKKLTSRNIYDDDKLIFSDIIMEDLDIEELTKKLEEQEEKINEKIYKNYKN